MELLRIIIMGFLMILGMSCLGGWLLLASLHITKDDKIIISDPSDEVESITK